MADSINIASTKTKSELQAWFNKDTYSKDDVIGIINEQKATGETETGWPADAPVQVNQPSVGGKISLGSSGPHYYDRNITPNIIYPLFKIVSELQNGTHVINFDVITDGYGMQMFLGIHASETAERSVTEFASVETIAQLATVTIRLRVNSALSRATFSMSGEGLSSKSAGPLDLNQELASGFLDVFLFLPSGAHAGDVTYENFSYAYYE